MEQGQFDEASTELEAVLQAAPDNLAAIRALADIHQRRGDILETIDLHVAPLDAPPPVDLSLDATMPTFADSGARAPSAAAGEQPFAISEEHLPSLDALDALSLDLPPMPDLGDWTLDTSLALDLPAPTFSEPPLDRLDVPVPPAAAPADPVLEELEQWLAAIVADRGQSR
jgi:hypothetical protein